MVILAALNLSSVSEHLGGSMVEDPKHSTKKNERALKFATNLLAVLPLAPKNCEQI